MKTKTVTVGDHEYAIEETPDGWVWYEKGKKPRKSSAFKTRDLADLDLAKWLALNRRLK